MVLVSKVINIFAFICTRYFQLICRGFGLYPTSLCHHIFYMVRGLLLLLLLAKHLRQFVIRHLSLTPCVTKLRPTNIWRLVMLLLTSVIIFGFYIKSNRTRNVFIGFQAALGAFRGVILIGAHYFHKMIIYIL